MNNIVDIKKLKEDICMREGRIVLVGIDTSSSKNDACFRLNGRNLIDNYRFSHDAKGFEKFSKVIEDVIKKEESTQVVAGLESTANYWKPLAAYLMNKGIIVTMVSNKAVKKNRSTQEQSKQKNDRLDAKNIANLLEQGKFHYCNIKKGKDLVLEQLVRQRLLLVKEKSKMLNRIKINYLPVYFHEFTKIFSLDNKKSLILLKTFNTPHKFMNANYAELRKYLTASMVKKSYKKWTLSDIKLFLTNTISINCPDNTGVDITINYYVNDILRLEEEIEKLDRHIDEYIDDPEFDHYKKAIDSGIANKNTIANVIACFGDIRKFSQARQLTKMAGLDVCLSSSNEWRSRARISKEGNSGWRRYSYLVQLTNKRINPVLKRLYERKQINSPGKGSKKRALIAVMDKHLRMIWAATVFQEKFDISKLEGVRK